jgi:hypothetical protein
MMDLPRIQATLERAGVVFERGLDDVPFYFGVERFRRRERPRSIELWTRLVEANE